LNTGKEIEAMKRLTLHRIASSLHRFIAFVAQLCWCHSEKGFQELPLAILTGF
jgi:hypothetical protein